MNSIETVVCNAAEKHGRERDKLLPVLQDVVEAEKFLSEDAMKAVAREFGISSAEVYGVATFYSFIDVSRLGTNVIRICKTNGTSGSGMAKAALSRAKISTVVIL